MAIIGIDLGTTNSLAVAYLNEGVVPIPNVYGDYLTPSVVSIDAQNTVTVGKSAKQRLVSHPNETTALFKRNMGTQNKVSIHNHNYLPEELSAFVVKQLVEDAKAFLNEDIEEIVISVPAYFNNEQRGATKRIGEILGIKVERLVNEPSAASIACHQGRKDDESFIVFDFGGGTLDVSVVDCFDNVVSICAIAGNNQLGGCDFDRKIAYDFCEQNKLNFDSLYATQQEGILFHCEKAKMELQNAASSKIEFHMNGIVYTYTLTNDKLRFLGKSIFEKMKAVIAEAVNSSGFENNEIDKLVMVGGSCHMPVVTCFLKELLNIEVHEEVEKDRVVASGLGIYVGIKQRADSVRDLVLTDICPFSLSTSVNNEKDPSRPFADVLIPKNTVLPATKMKNYVTLHKGQKILKVDVYQGEGIYCDQVNLLATKNIRLPHNKDYEDIETTFIYDINSLLCVEVKILSTNEVIVFNVGSKLYSVENIENIKNASMKIKLEPQLEYIDAQVARIMAESAPYVQSWLKERYIEFLDLMNRYHNNLRKRTVLLNRMQQILTNVNEEMKHCDIFQEANEDENKGFLS